MFATQAANAGIAHSELGLDEVGNVRNLVELTAHWQKLQHFLQQWGTRQEQLLMCGGTNALVDAAQIHLMEVARPPETCPEGISENGGSEGAVSPQASSSACPSPTGPVVKEAEANPGSGLDQHAQQMHQLHSFHRSRSGKFGNIGQSTSLVHSIVARKGFDILCGIVIFTNAFMIGVISDYAIKNPLEETPLFLSSCETSFIVFYTFEICLRMLDQRSSYFTGGDKWWNLFDVVLVIQGVSEQMLKDVSNFSFLRMLRLMKMLKLLRMVRLLRMFRELRLILTSICACLSSMLWTSVLIISITYLFGIAFMQACTGYLQEPDDQTDPRIRASILENWGSAPRSILSLYMSSLGGLDWEKVVEPLAYVGFGGAYYVLFLIYIAVFAFVIMNVISSIFMESILSRADEDHNLNIERQMEQKEAYIHKLQNLYSLLDNDKSGEISYDEFMSEIHSPHMQAFTSSLGIDISDAQLFFQDISDHGKRSVDMDTFVVGCIKLKGAAKSVDLIDMKYTCKRSYAAQRKASIELHETATMLHTAVDELHQMASEQHKSTVVREASDQRVLRDLATLTTYVKQQEASAVAAGVPATTQSETAREGFHLQL